MNLNKLKQNNITFRPVDVDKDLEFLYRVYFESREDEMAQTDWGAEQIDNFLRWQFQLQHKQYWENYKNAQFDVIKVHNKDAGRLYMHRRKNDMCIIDIALLKEFRGKGHGGKIMKELVEEAYKRDIPINLHVEQDNPAMHLYERLGFIKGELTGVYYPMERPPEPIE